MKVIIVWRLDGFYLGAYLGERLGWVRCRLQINVVIPHRKNGLELTNLRLTGLNESCTMPRRTCGYC